MAAEHVPLRLAACLLIVPSLWGCTAEPTSPEPASQGDATALTSATGPGGNYPPVVRHAKIFPVDVTLETTLRLDVQGEDMDGDRLTYRYQWLVNGRSIPGATDPHFATDRLRKGDQVAAELTPNDGKVDGARLTTDPVTVGNTAPDNAEIRLEPVPLYRGETLRVKVVAGDPDGDPVSLSYTWLRNGKEIPGARTDRLDTQDFRKKDVLVVLVTLSDGKAAREPRAGVPVMIENAPPRFTSTPPTDMKDGQYVYPVTAIDPDEDPVTLELQQAPSGMTMDAATGTLTWKLPPESKGRHRVVIVAKDNEDGATQQDFELESQLPAQETSP